MELAFIFMPPLFVAFASFIIATGWMSITVSRASKAIEEDGVFLYHGRKITVDNLDAFDRKIGVRALTAPLVATMAALSLALIGVSIYGIIIPVG